MRNDIDFATCMGTVARALLGESNRLLSSRDEWRYGSNGSTGTWFDHEMKEGGGVLALIKSKRGLEGSDALQFLHDLGCIARADNPLPKPNGDAKEIEYDAAKDPFKNAAFKKESKFRIVETWSYRDENGIELFEVCRKENGEIGKDRKAVKTYYQRCKMPEGFRSWSCRTMTSQARSIHNWFYQSCKASQNACVFLNCLAWRLRCRRLDRVRRHTGAALRARQFKQRQRQIKSFPSR